MVHDHRYVENETEYLPIARSAFGYQFPGPFDFDTFYASLSTPVKKNQFLRTASFYYYLVKAGGWVVTAHDSNSVIDYLTNSYKVVGLFALIESLSTASHLDFYEWIKTQDPDKLFPIASRSALAALHTEYKKTFGSIRRCVGFFERLPQKRKEVLCAAIRVNNAPLPSIKKVAEYLYSVRSNFVHEGHLVLQISNSTIYSDGKSVTVAMPGLLEAFEEGLLAYFRED